MNSVMKLSQVTYRTRDAGRDADMWWPMANNRWVLPSPTPP